MIQIKKESLFKLRSLNINMQTFKNTDWERQEKKNFYRQ